MMKLLGGVEEIEFFSVEEAEEESEDNYYQSVYMVAGYFFS